MILESTGGPPSEWAVAGSYFEDHYELNWSGAPSGWSYPVSTARSPDGGQILVTIGVREPSFTLPGQRELRRFYRLKMSK